VSASEFRAPVLRGLAWKSATRITFELTKFGVAVALARLLTPHEWGIAGMVIVIIAFEPALGGVALASALVQRPEITEADRSTVFWVNAAVGIAVCAIGIAVSWPVAAFYGDSQVQPLFAALSVVFLLSALSSVQIHLLVREMEFRSLELRSMVGVVAGAAAAVVVAAEGGGAWALIAQQLAFYGVSLVLLWRFSRWRPHFVFSRASLREMRRFGGNVSGTLILFQLNQNTDNVLIGRFIGASQLGVYALAYNVILVPFSRLASPLQEVLYPVFSRLQADRARLAAMWLRVVRLVAALAVPAMLGLIVVAPDAVSVVFGHRWHAATPVIRILAFVGLLFVLQGLNSIVLQAVDRTRLLFRYALVCFVAGAASFALGLHWGIVGVAACFAAVSAVIQPIYMHLTARAVGVGLTDCARALRGVVDAAVLAAAAMALARAGLVGQGVGGAGRLAAVVAVGVAVYLPTLAWRAPDVVAEVARLVRRRSTVPSADVAPA
jgi:O-antigen/teichoic acid export membrane protein